MEHVVPGDSTYFSSKKTRIFEILKRSVDRIEEACPCGKPSCPNPRDKVLTELSEEISTLMERSFVYDEGPSKK